MSRRSARTFLVLISLALCCACSPSMPPPGYHTVTVKGVRISPLPLQRLSAVHEAAHTVLSELYLGPDFVREVHIDTECCAPGLHYHLGDTEPARGVDIRSSRVKHEVIMMLLAGEEAEHLVLGDAATDDTHDRAVAAHVARMLLDLPDVGVLSDTDAARVAEVLRVDGVRARFVVSQNGPIVLALAGLIMARPVRHHRRTVDAAMLHAFFSTHHPHDPLLPRLRRRH